MTQEFYSNGKLLISGEYAVLDGALAWALPTKFGQYLRISSNNSKIISWKSLNEKESVWFEGSYDCTDLKEISTSDLNISKALQNILSAAQDLNPVFLKDSSGYDIETELTFPKDWGLGSSSTLINNIANWANVNAQDLLSKTFGGSGYDIACAQHNTPILFQIEEGSPITEEIHSKPSFSHALYFIYLNKKKNSRDAISAYRSRNVDKASLIETISQLSKKLIACTSLEQFENLIITHEQTLSSALGIPTVKSELFPDYSGAVKSLGGWGGDFILATGDTDTPAYFKSKGYHIILSFKEMIL